MTETYSWVIFENPATFFISIRLSTTSLTESKWLIIISKSNWDFKKVNNINNELRFSESKFPNPSSIAKKLGLGRLDTFTSAVLIANDEINFSIPDVNSNGQKLSSS